ncbi:MAG: class I SAM-dependent methyltransferase [Acidobacteria bacterium]|nr:MAG: class I SAM-dependent methyltransferase [Acidobacteriota bacterium]REK04098.1 MAG: class I SAM-dependent methyltransferase [Acidobacteriota bacterium]REK15260.1 MAG: class I SAM-dependent methyltransferase [Acidobacteriota bacterium]REK46350.1 MAG: class I SAM-dependent methyltransferase [Acidobacteriota bacterium]
MTCSLCGNSEFEIVSERDAKSGGDLLVGMCVRCGLVQQTNIPTELDLSFYYSHSYREDYKGTLVPKPKHIFRSANAAVDRLDFLAGAGVEAGRLLDIGSGSGEFVYLANRSGFEAKGIEPNRGYVEYSSSEYECEYSCGFLDAARGEYDVVTAFHVLEHLPDPVRAFEKLHDLLSRKGVLIVEVPWLEAKDASPHNIFFGAHVYYFTADTLKACASQFFSIANIDTTVNLRAVFKPRPESVEFQIPAAESVEQVKRRLREKGWLEYVTAGGGAIRPLQKLQRAVRESAVRGMSGKEITDMVYETRSSDSEARGFVH